MRAATAKQYEVKESIYIALLLAFVGGYLDIYCYLARGKVFANTQTGNLILLGYGIATKDIQRIIYYSLALSAFLSGVCLAKFMEYRFKVKRYLEWLDIILVLEMVLLIIVMYIPGGHYNALANIMLSFICALQLQGFRKVDGYAYSTVMFTNNLRNSAEQYTAYFLTKDPVALHKASVYLGVTVMFMVGGIVGTLLTNRFDKKAVGFTDFILLIVFIILYLEKRKMMKYK